MKFSSSAVATFLAVVAVGLDSYKATADIPLYADEQNYNPKHVLEECEGDCDNDNNCNRDLICYQFRKQNETPPKGCSGKLFKYPNGGVYDYCACPPEGCRNEDMKHDAIELHGDKTNWNPTHPLSECEGDCDNDSQCKDDLICYKYNDRNGFKEEAPKGCKGSPYKLIDGGVYDYCACPPEGCKTYKRANPTTYGDPHFKTWSGEQFDFPWSL